MMPSLRNDQKRKLKRRASLIQASFLGPRFKCAILYVLLIPSLRFDPTDMVDVTAFMIMSLTPSTGLMGAVYQGSAKRARRFAF